MIDFCDYVYDGVWNLCSLDVEESSDQVSFRWTDTDTCSYLLLSFCFVESKGSRIPAIPGNKFG